MPGGSFAQETRLLCPRIPKAHSPDSTLCTRGWRGPLEPTHIPKLREKVADFPWLHFIPLTRSILLWRPAAEVWYGHGPYKPFSREGAGTLLLLQLFYAQTTRGFFDGLVGNTS